MTEPLSDRVWTIPNLVSLVRLLCVPWFLWVLFGQDDPGRAGIIIGVVGATDWLDGTLARVLDQESELGRQLDPIADRLAIVAAVVGGAIWGVLPVLFVGPLIIRELGMAGLAMYLFLKKHATLQVRYIGKLATALVYISIPAFYLSFSYAPQVLETLGWVIGVAGLVLYWYVAVQYVGDARELMDASSDADK